MNSKTSQNLVATAIVGATGAVGQELLHLLEPRAEEFAPPSLFASARSAGKQVPFRGSHLVVHDLELASFAGFQVAFFSAGAARSHKYVPKAIEAGGFVADNSSAFRMDPQVPLVVPEINGNLITPEVRLASVPNCSAIILLMAVAPLLQLAAIDRLIVSTYQSASGGGAAMMKRLEEETKYFLENKEHPDPNLAYPPYAFNLFSHNTPIDESGANQEEAKVIQESRRILNLPDLKINVTCVRVPVLRAHTESVTVEFAGPRPSLAEITDCYNRFPGIKLVDNRDQNEFPTPRLASGQGDVLVGRLRNDPSNPRAISMLIAGDQLLKGAALTALQIAELSIQATKLAVV